MIDGNACLVILGATVVLVVSQDPTKSPSTSFHGQSLPETRPHSWPSWSSVAFHTPRPEHHRISLHDPSSRDIPVRNWRHLDNDAGHPEKLTAVASAEFMGTRAVAYAGFSHHQHHRQHHHPGHQQRGDFFSPIATAAPPPAPGVYTKHHPGRRVCSRPAPAVVSHHHRGRQTRFVYTEFPSSFSCCPGWTQVTRLSFGCNKPACATTCLNGGTCVAPGKCACPKQFTGKQCQIDVDECITEKPCAQLCQNTLGSYQCSCRAGYQLQPDGQSCLRNDSDGTAFEARDLEADYRTTTTRTTSTVPQDADNEVGDRDFDKDYEFILRRLAKLEKLVARSKRRDAGATEMSAKINLAVENIGEMKRAVESVRVMQKEVYDLRNKLIHIEEESRKMQHLANRIADLEARLRIHCSGSFGGHGRSIC